MFSLTVALGFCVWFLPFKLDNSVYVMVTFSCGFCVFVYFFLVVVSSVSMPLQSIAWKG